MEYQKLIDYRNGIPGFTKEMGMVVTAVAEGYAQVEMELDARSHNPIGSTHGGVIFAIADTAGGVAATSRGSCVTTVEGSINYLNAAMQGTKKLIAATRELKAGKNILVYDVTVSDETGRVIAEARMSYFSLHKPLEL
ncbi:MAG: PaaI family thioesterase [Lachnospiraceae bacterium]|nr:PaaI family thioesterase [Lachnospiraceae bacterium]MCI9149902.1 PaaI family thioesterase [Lachnospiraceae bacterium]